MVPPEEIEKAQPSTLPADFSEWDNGEDPATQPASFNGFEAVPRPPARPATARVAVSHVVDRLPSVDRLPNTVSRASTRAYAEAEQLFQPPPPPPRSTNPYVSDQKPRSIFVEEEEETESEGTRKGVGMYAAIGAVAVLLIAGGLGYYKMRPSKTPAPYQPVATQAATTASTTTVVTPPKPTAATSAATGTTASQTEQTPATDTAVPEKPVRSQVDVVHQMNATSRIPNDLRMLAGKEPPPSTGFSPSGMDGLGGTGGAGNIFSGQSGPKVKVEAPKKLTISAGVAGGLLIQKTAPVYPQLAKEARVSGTVVIQATISRTGAIQNLRVVNGPTMLRQPALDAVKTWRYRPYLLDGEPVEVETTVSVTFTLGG